MTGYELTYLDRAKQPHQEVHGIRAQAISYAMAYAADGFKVLSLIDRATGKEVPYTPLTYEQDEAGRVGFDPRTDEA